MPEKGNNTLRFNNFHKQLPIPFVIYADFEAITEKIPTCTPENNQLYTIAYQKVVCCYDDKYTKPRQIYRGENVLYKFMEKMVEEVDIIIARKSKETFQYTIKNVS